jgi:hypothetical protein
MKPWRLGSTFFESHENNLQEQGVLRCNKLTVTLFDPKINTIT